MPVVRQRLTAYLVANAMPQAISYCVYDDLVFGLALRVFPSGRRSYVVRYKHCGYGTIGDPRLVPLKEARLMAREALLAVAKGQDPFAERRTAPTFEQVAADHLRHTMAHNRSWRQSRRLVERFFLPAWGRQPAQSITRADAKAVLSRIASKAVHNQALAALSSLLSHAVREGSIPSNPVIGIERFSLPSRDRVLSDCEVKLVWPELCTPLRLVLLLGVRSSEVLRIGECTIADGWWLLPAEMVKSKRAHRVFVGHLGSMVADAKRIAPRPDLSAAMRIVCENLGVERATVHDLRRTFASTCAKIGITHQALSRLLNHSSGKKLIGIYDRYTYEREDEEAWRKAADYIFRLVNTNERACLG